MTGDLLRPPAELTRHAAALFTAAGLDREKAESTARLLVLTDMMGRRTHGLAQVPAYLDQVERGLMERSGEPEVLRDTGGTVVWDGGYRPGLWLMERALKLGFERLPQHGTFTLAMRKSHHIGCLAALAKQATDRGYLAIIASSGPHTKIVAPFGGKEGLFSPNPFAIGFPATEFPVLVDISSSITSLSMTREKAAAGAQFDNPWVLDHEGRPSRDPSVVEGGEARGSLMLLGGTDAGHKGFGLALLVEALTGGLAGYGRKDAPTRWGASVFLQLLDPAAFAGRDAFVAQMDFLADRIHANPAIDPDAPVRLPGEKAARLIAGAERDGVRLPAALAEALRGHAARLGVEAIV
ncbi:Ldh family oxidoreductase [Pararoseomonas indoligenes]|uniref:Ldh family oxidoreductase n=1 Tax=Roseomonas indoligenes TaxID=2820811 RepID=UPI0031592418